MPANNKTLATLKEKIASLALPIQQSGNSPLASNISGKTFVIDSADSHLKSISIEFKNGDCFLSLKTDSVTHAIGFGKDKWIQGETSKWGPYLVSRAKANRNNISSYKIAGSYDWKNEKTLELTLRYIESPHTEIIQCIFDEGKMSIDFESSFNRAEKVIYKGTLTSEIGKCCGNACL